MNDVARLIAAAATSAGLGVWAYRLVTRMKETQ